LKGPRPIAAALAAAAAFAFLAPRARANPPRDPQDAAPGEWLAPWVHGAVRYKGYFYPEGGRQKNDRARNQGEADLDLTPRLDEVTPGLRTEFLYRALYDDEELSAGAFNDRGIRRPILNLREAFFAYERERFEARVGKQIYSWGKADLYNPTDTLNARDYIDLLESEKIGAWSVSARVLGPGEVAFEAVAIPFFFIPARLPPRGARYDLVPPGLAIPIEDRDMPPGAWKTTQAGLRVSGTIAPLDLDWALTAYHGRDHVPNTRLHLKLVPVPPFGLPSLEPFYKREDVLGASVARAFSSFEAHAEGGYFFHGERDEDEYAAYVVGGNYRKADLFDPSDELFLVFEYAGQWVTDRSAPGVIPNVLSRVFRSAILARGRYSFSGGDLVLEATGVFLLYSKDSQYFQAKLAWRALDWLKLTLGWDVLAGPKNTFFGQFRDDDRAFAFLEVTF
jgi:hypothetical protein